MGIERGKRYINRGRERGKGWKRDIDRWRGEKGRGKCRDSNRYRRGQRDKDRGRKDVHS